MKDTWSQFVDLVEQMRDKQKEYFRTRDKVVLQESKILEGKVDRWVADQKTPQMNIFPDGGD